MKFNHFKLINIAIVTYENKFLRVEGAGGNAD